MTESRQRLFKAFLLVTLAGVMTMTLQRWVGAETVYHPDLQENRMLMHHAILENKPSSEFDWQGLGAGTTNIRVLTVFLVDRLHHATGASVSSLYEHVGSFFLFLSFLLLFWFLRMQTDEVFGIIGLLYYASVLSLTYFIYAFHPWDRPSTVIWIAVILLIRENRLVPVAVGLAVGVAVKYDMVLLPGLYWLYRVSSRDWKRVTLVSAGLLAVSFGTYFALRTLFPGGFPHHGTPILERTLAQIERNIKALRVSHIGYPPLLVFALPLTLALYWFRSAGRFERACTVFAILLLPVFFFASNFIEVRAEMPVLVLLLPSALLGLRNLLDGSGRVASPQLGRVPRPSCEESPSG